MKVFIIKSLFFLLVVLVIITGVNYFGDAAHIFDQNYERKISNILLSDNNCTGLSNYDERLLQKLLVESKSEDPEVVVLGSSRMMLIGENEFVNRDVLNNSVSGASLEDLIGIYQLYKKEDKLPEKIIIGIDPWIFNANHGQRRWKTLSKEYSSFVGVDDSFNNNKLKQIISPTYFQASFSEIWNFEDKPILTSKAYNVTNTKISDGSIIYGKKRRLASDKEILAAIDDYVNGELYSLGDFNKISPFYLRNFKLLIADILKNGIDLNLVLMPYPPKVYQVIKDEYPKVIKVEKLIKNLAQEEKINLKGSYNPNLLNLNNIDFYDGMHLKKENVNLLVQ